MRVLFVDVDGPLIPSGMYLLHKRASFDRHFSPVSIAVLKHMLKESGAKLVMNTTHNLDGEKAKQDLVLAGIDEESFGTPWRTDYPVNRSRQSAIDEWISKQTEEIDWMALDDADFTEDKRLILVDFDEGIHLRHYNRMSQKWKLKNLIIL